MLEEQHSSRIRETQPEDVEELHSLVCDLADFENLRETVASTPRDLHRALFGNSPRVEALVAEITPHGLPEQSKGPSLTGMAFFFQTFSTFTGRQGLWLEDLYVRPEYRNQGIGKALLTHFLSVAQSRGCARAEWSVLDWNTSAIDFYEHLGAEIMPEWRIARLDLQK